MSTTPISDALVRYKRERQWFNEGRRGSAMHVLAAADELAEVVCGQLKAVRAQVERQLLADVEAICNE
jgi:hypothetical protein